MHPRGETPPENLNRFFESTLCKRFGRCAPRKGDIFRELLEEIAFRLTDRRYRFDLTPFILKEKEDIIMNEIM